ncbi:DNA/RNA helicase domain-containing protein [Microvirgula aerodenitrificans]|uniref:DNA/RNA helicase domain-containing protein n=1 Tax=Microvirgula aerodenitrificans TaxID=57480 RepID=UPI00248D9701|nr:DNA/RNA helicase domain-containing protein [Microvirgula aerodenitrificans]
MQPTTPTHTLIYQADKQQFLLDSDRYIEDLLEARYQAIVGKRVSSQEKVSWKNSLQEMARVLRDERIPATAGIGIELFAPQSMSRIDFTLSGFDAHGQKTIIIIELKQWSAIKLTDKDAVVLTQLGGGLNEALHPSYQAWAYATLFEGFNEAVASGEIRVLPCAFLHNYSETDNTILDERFKEYTQQAPLFRKGMVEREKLQSFLSQHIQQGDNQSVLQQLISSRIGASKALADALAKLMEGNREFALINDQKLVFESIKNIARAAAPGKHKVVIVEGGPGTGKTLIAINLLVKLLKTSMAIKYISKNAAPRHVYKAKLTGSMKQTRFNSLFAGSDNFHDMEQNTFDLLLVDEAHRLTEKSGMFNNKGENQMKELINAAKCTVFFIDEDQRVTFRDIGSKEQIRQWAVAKGAEVHEFELTSQFRCSGSDGYMAWLDNVLGIRETANTQLDTKSYEFKVFDTPEEMHAAVKLRNSGNRARVVAGYCWPWNSKTDTTQMDIVIGDNYQRQWNLASNSMVWIIAPDSIEQVGCIHTCQGLEVDYIGVIIGPDLIIRNGKVVTDAAQRSSMDQTIRGYKTQVKKQPEETSAKADRIIKNTYRTLMTRGLKGCFLYCTDPETAVYFRSKFI